MKTKSNITPASKKKIKPKHAIRNLSLSSYKKIIDEYWDNFNRTLEEYNSDVMSTSDIDPRAIQLICNLKKVETWKSNLFILHMHFHSLQKLSKILKVNQSSLSVYLSNIKKEIKCL